MRKDPSRSTLRCAEVIERMEGTSFILVNGSRPLRRMELICKPRVSSSPGWPLGICTDPNYTQASISSYGFREWALESEFWI
jgi:hypothetical protein